MTRYKLTTQDMKTRKGETNETTWEVGRWVEATGDPSGELCSDSYLHWYSHPLLAILLNPIHAAIDNPRLWEIETEGDELVDRGMKGGSRRLRLVREVVVPKITAEQLARIAILCSKAVYKNNVWLSWADARLAGAADAADAAAYAARAASYAAARASYATSDAAWQAAHDAAWVARRADFSALVEHAFAALPDNTTAKPESATGIGGKSDD